jgi:nitrogen fixation protein FixH
MNNFPLVTTLGLGSLLAFFLYFVFFKVIHLGGKISALATAAAMLLAYVPLAVIYWAGIDVFAIHFAFFMMVPYGLGIINGVHEERREKEGAAFDKGMHWIPALIIIFFILVAVVDSFIISSATSGLESTLAKVLLPQAKSADVGKHISSQFTGAVSNNNQDEEKQFDEYVLQLKEQRQRGWKISGKWEQPPPMMNQPAIFTFTAKNKLGEAITGATVTTDFRRSSDMKQDSLVSFKETGAGIYSASVTLPLAGCWMMKVLLKKGDDEHEIKGETEISMVQDGKLVTPKCSTGEPDIDPN